MFSYTEWTAAISKTGKLCFHGPQALSSSGRFLLFLRPILITRSAYFSNILSSAFPYPIQSRKNLYLLKSLF